MLYSVIPYQSVFCGLYAPLGQGFVPEAITTDTQYLPQEIISTDPSAALHRNRR